MQQGDRASPQRQGPGHHAVRGTGKSSTGHSLSHMASALSNARWSRARGRKEKARRGKGSFEAGSRPSQSKKALAGEGVAAAAAKAAAGGAGPGRISARVGHEAVEVGQ